jgi:glycosyltransferase involved in cell wall biosynthesis
MRIGIDARFITQFPRRGIGSYSLNVVRELVRLNPEFEFFLYISASDKGQDLPIADNVRVRKLFMPTYPLWEQLALPCAAIRDRLDILHCLGNTAPLLLSRSIKLILTLHDVMFLQNEAVLPRPTNIYQVIGRLYRRLICPRVARSAGQIITVSDFSRRDICRMIPDLDSQCIHVSYQSCDIIFNKVSSLTFETKEAASKIKSYIFALGADDPRKNTLRLVKAYLHLYKTQGLEHSLVISGYSNWEKSEAYNLVMHAGATEKVRFLPFVSMDELVRLYRNAVLFVYPSLYEGFGIPLLEAFSCGCPVIASNSTSIPEVGGDAVLYVDPLCIEEIGSSIFRLIHDKDLRVELIQRGHARALAFSWGETAMQTVSAYERCLAISNK